MGDMTKCYFVLPWNYSCHMQECPLLWENALISMGNFIFQSWAPPSWAVTQTVSQFRCSLKQRFETPNVGDLVYELALWYCELVVTIRKYLW